MKVVSNESDKSEPLVSIIIPVYNGSNYMREAIESALRQTYKNIEILVINDGSKDNGLTEKIAKSYGNKIKYFYKENGGVSTALNFGIKHMKGQFFSWLSHDDRYYPNKIQTQIDFLNENNLMDKKVITYTNYDVIDEHSDVVNFMHFDVFEPNLHSEYSILHGLASGTSLLIPKSAFDEYGLFDEKYRCIQDYLLFFKFLNDYKYVFIPYVVTNSTRVHSGQVTNTNPNVIKENNFLWKYMISEFPDDKKINLNGSLYKFYLGMNKYLNSIVIYPDAIKYTEDKMNEQIKKYYNQIINSYKINREQFINSIYNSYNLLLRKTNYYLYDPEVVNDSDILNDIIDELGLKCVLDISIKEFNELSPLFSKILNRLDVDFNGDTIIRLSLTQKIKALRSEGGWKLVYFNCKRKMFNILNSSSVCRVILRFLRVLRKIVFFIPKIILRFILNS